MTYEAQVDEERRGYAKAVAELFKRARSPESSFWDSLGVTALTVPLRNWIDLGGPIDQFGAFLVSPYLPRRATAWRRGFDAVYLLRYPKGDVQELAAPAPPW